MIKEHTTNMRRFFDPESFTTTTLFAYFVGGRGWRILRSPKRERMQREKKNKRIMHEE